MAPFPLFTGRARLQQIKQAYFNVTFAGRRLGSILVANMGVVISARSPMYWGTI
jgi:hypothetical protein